MTKKSKQEFKYLENEKSFQGEIKALFIFFEGHSDAKNCLTLECIFNIPEEYSEPSRASKMEFFAKLVNCKKSLTISIKSSVSDI